MKSKKKLLIILIIILLSTFIGISYAYWRLIRVQSIANSFTVACFKTSFEESSDINLSSAYPISDTEGQKLTPYSFIITNTCDASANYQVNLDTLNTSTLNVEYIKLALDNNPPALLNSFETTTPTADSTLESRKLANGVLKKGESITYKLRLWLNFDALQATSEGKIYESKIAVVTTNYQNGDNILAHKVLLKYGGKGAIENKAPIVYEDSAPKVAIYKDNGFSNDVNSVSLSTSQQSQYVTYASSYTFNSTTGLYSLTNPTTAQYSSCYSLLSGKYLIPYFDYETDFNSVFSDINSAPENADNINIYKIVSAPYNASAGVNITYNSLKSTNIMPESVDTYDSASSGMWSTTDDYGQSYFFRGKIADNNVIFGGFCWKIIRINGNETTRIIYNGLPYNGTCVATGTDAQIGTSEFNTNYDDNAYVGYMYGTAGSTSYDATHANTNSSTIKTYIDNWYKNNLAIYADKISDSYFCNNRNLSYGIGFGTSFTKYLKSYSYSYVPTFKCPQQHDRFTTTDTTIGNGNLTYPVGLITFTEINRVGNYNQFNYLYTGTDYWTMTPFSYTSEAYVTTNKEESISANTKNGVRPVINLNADVISTSGDGTSSNPYLIS